MTESLFSGNTKRIKSIFSSKASINVLFVGGGRRVSLAERFIQKGCKVFAYETDLNSPISKIATVIAGLRWKDPELLEHLNFTCMQNNINLIIPLQDEAIPLCCKVSTAKCPAKLESAEICYDKKKFEEFFQYATEYPYYNADENVDDKIIAKPRFGFNSKGITICFPDDLMWKWGDDLLEHNVIQRYVEGKEYSVDCYFNKSSDLIDFVPRQRVSVQGGEVVQSITISRKDVLYNKFGQFISEWFKKIKAVGPYCIQFIEKDNNIYIIEANARFGGGVILSLEAGFDIIELILSEYLYNTKIEQQLPIWKENFSMTRYFSEHFYNDTSL